MRDTAACEAWLTEQTAAALAGKQVALVDAPVPGAQWGAQAADLVFMLGGADALEARGHTAVDVVLTTMDGVVHHRQWTSLQACRAMT